MDAIINKISEIESAAAAIMDDANNRKKAYAKDIDDKTSSFDAGLEKETEEKIRALRARMEIEMREKLARQKSDAQAELALMEENYQSHHQIYAKQIFDAMTKE